ncbi:hypothetical protein M406DRAFT_354677 [Cryphonectria parasitica EP155]|uniref:Uncharacterized protein n=1 Tax=Cryphonectria parasitica (strain ATCC 38755 / EP155) TaxID=660469 RepID=A0A9P5CWC7_CRYP1|nr:uncharacterized protein M406DRAFT_354677 [Cryphonectria parasitica EP155]KAF3771050.1 hypothetical protein M406DRAFT_354677 [Cryphonectria parasitica EP155]
MLRRQAQAAAAGGGAHRYGPQQAPPRMATGMNMPGMAEQRPPVPPDGARFAVYGQPGPRPGHGGVDIVDVGREGKRGKSGDRKKKAMSWFGGGAPARKSSKKKR